MDDKLKSKIFFIGGGAIATALGNILAGKENLEVSLLTIEHEVADSINEKHINHKYFPSFKLNQRLRSSTDFAMLEQEAIVFIAIPSVAVIDFLSKTSVHPKSVLINLAKGFGNDRLTIVENLPVIVPNPVCTMKGPSFAREIINGQPTGFTLGSTQKSLFKAIGNLFADTSVYCDYAADVRGVELLSILKNIYAIVIGVVDAQFESPNLKFLIFTKAFSEMRALLLLFGGNKKTLFSYCGIGDFALTALNDLSRNRTLGLLIGKGFFTDYISERVVLEGRIAVNVFYDELKHRKVSISDYPILNELYKVFNSEYDISGFVGKLLAENGMDKDRH
jgi:glycerol-3-phosphate dehydrogenase (NAD(P)+)